MKNREYASSTPLARLEKGDKAFIRVSKFPPSIVKEKDRKKYKDVPNGVYEAVCIEPFKLKCEQYPILSGSYNYWRGDKRGCSEGIYADEVKESEDMPSLMKD